jgi:hypothetical protein
MEELENDLKAFLDVDESDKILPILLRQQSEMLYQRDIHLELQIQKKKSIYSVRECYL